MKKQNKASDESKPSWVARLSRIKREVKEIRSNYDHALKSVREETERLATLQQKLSDCKQAVEVVQIVAQAVQQAVHAKIAGVVTRCLEVVFDDPYEFQIHFETKRNRTEARLVFVRNEVELDPMSAAGGGVVDVAAFALRVACLTLMQNKRQVLILDEPCKFVSRDLQPRLRPMIESLARDLGIQFVIVTHMETLQMGNVVRIGAGAGSE